MSWAMSWAARRCPIHRMRRYSASMTPAVPRTTTAGCRGNGAAEGSASPMGGGRWSGYRDLDSLSVEAKAGALRELTSQYGVGSSGSLISIRTASGR
jgi:hypothetical protein